MSADRGMRAAQAAYDADEPPEDDDDECDDDGDGELEQRVCRECWCGPGPYPWPEMAVWYCDSPHCLACGPEEP